MVVGVLSDSIGLLLHIPGCSPVQQYQYTLNRCLSGKPTVHSLTFIADRGWSLIYSEQSHEWK